MNALYLLITEAIFIGILIVFLHKLKKYFGIGLLFVFLGAVQFFQTILASSVYNKIFDYFIISPGSSVIFTSTLLTILLIFHCENILKTRTIIFGLMISNIVITILSVFSYQQLYIDNNSININFLENILNFDMTLFMIGTCLLYIDAVLLIIIYEFLNLKLSSNYLFLKILISLSLISLLDSVVFYSINFFSIKDSGNLLLSSIVGKQISVVIFALIMYFYLKIIRKTVSKNKPKNLNEIFSIFTFNETRQTI